MKHILYLDTAFASQQGGDKNRSRQLWHVLSQNYRCDLVLLNADQQDLNQHSGFERGLPLSVSKGRGLTPECIWQTPQQNKQLLQEFVRHQQYDAIIVRFMAPAQLIEAIQELQPQARVIYDVDMLFSRLAEMAWNQSPGLQNRYHWIQAKKLRRFEDRFFKQSAQFLFSNPIERDLVLSRHPHANSENFQVLPNIMPTTGVRLQWRDKTILFFGTLDSIANRDAFVYLRDQIYPHLESDLLEQGWRIRVCGKNPGSVFYEQNLAALDIIGPCADMSHEIASASMVLLPLRVASGTRTRILESAVCQTPVITTSIGLEGLNLPSAHVADNAQSIIQAVQKWMKEPETARQAGKSLQNEAELAYSQSIFTQVLHTAIESSVGSQGLKIALVSNRFFPEIGGAEINIYHQARALAKQHQVTVYCPKRIAKAEFEHHSGFGTWRLNDWLHRKQAFPNLAAKTLCPEIFWKIFKGNYDVVQLFPALNLNNYLALAAAKLSGKKTLLCSFDYLDYASLIPSGQLRPDILADHQPGWKQKLAIKAMDAICAISDREMDFYKRYHSQVHYSPVPVLADEYKTQADDPRGHYDLSQEDFVYLCLGRVSRIKGQDLALKAFAQVASQQPNARLVIVGRQDYEPELWHEMQAFIADQGLESRVIFTGMVSRPEVLGWLRYSQIHVIPVRFMNSGAVVVESWMGGIPVIQSDAVDPNLVVPGHNGYLFESENLNDLAKQMSLAYEQKADLPLMAARGQTLVQEGYTYDALIDIYQGIYEKVLGLKMPESTHEQEHTQLIQKRPLLRV